MVADDKRSVYFDEVRYKAAFEREDILKDASGLKAAGWNPCFLFIASRDGFYYGSVEDIDSGAGAIGKLSRISEETQRNFLSLLREFTD